MFVILKEFDLQQIVSNYVRASLPQKMSPRGVL